MAGRILIRPVFVLLALALVSPAGALAGGESAAVRADAAALETAEAFRLAGALVELASSTAAPGWAASLGLAAAATRLQAGLWDATDARPLPEATMAPSAYVVALAARHGAGLPAAQQARIEALNDLPSRDALAALLQAFADYEARTAAAFASIDAAALLAERNAAFHETSAAPALPAADFGAVLQSRAALLEAAGALASMAPLAAASIATVDLPPALYLDLGPGQANVHASDYALLIDAGGDDVYQNNAGGSNLVGGGCGGLPGSAAAAFDLGGDDLYQGPGRCGSHGGGWLGAGLLVDAAGNDRYLAGPQGACLSLLVPGTCGVNGGGALGVGALVDVNGADVYSGLSGSGPPAGAGSLGTNGGGDLGAGLLLDTGGSDVYEAGSYGTNGGSSAGLGLLLDTHGNDRYRAADAGTNGGAWGGMGFLVDRSGNDAFVGGRRGSNGGALDLGLPLGLPTFAFLFDGDGVDAYRDPLSGCDDCSRAPKGVLGLQLDQALGPPTTHGADLPSAPPAFSDDADGDGVPAAMVLPRRSVVIGGDGLVATGDAAPIVVPLDPDPTNDAVPIPKVAVLQGPYLDTTAACPDAQGRPRLDVVCYRVGAVIEVRSLAGPLLLGQVLVGEADAGALPLTLPPVPTGAFGVFDADGDGVPGGVSYRATTVTIHEDGTTSTTTLTTTTRIDPDDQDPSNPAGKPSAAAAISAGCQTDALCASASVGGNLLGSSYGVDQPLVVGLDAALDAAETYAGTRPLAIGPGTVAVTVPKTFAVSTAPQSLSAGGMRVDLNGGSAVFTPQGGLVVTTPAAAVGGPASATVPSILLNEHPTVVKAQRDALALVLDRAEAPIPSLGVGI